jgi:hypothetical protein
LIWILLTIVIPGLRLQSQGAMCVGEIAWK